MASTGGEQALYMASSPGPGSPGTPTTDLNTSFTRPPDPAQETLVDDNQSFTETPAGSTTGGVSPMIEPDSAPGIETASSPAGHPGAPGVDVVECPEVSGGAPTPQAGAPAEPPSEHVDIPDSLKPLGNQGQG
jgi:hypothetical protein